MEAERIIKEKEIVHDSEHKDYASKGVGNAGLTLGIIGTALGAWAVSRNRGGLFGGGCGAGMPENVNINTTTGGSGGSGVSISTKATDYQWLLFLRHYFGDLVVVC